MPSTTSMEEWVNEASKHFSEWDKSFCGWKSFSFIQLDLLRNYVGLAIFGVPNAPDLENIWGYFPKDQRKIIKKMTDKITFERSHVIVGHTYLYLDNQSFVGVIRQQKLNNKINFIDCCGRVYNSWTDFCNANRLPSCRYVAPNDGLHKMKQQLVIYRSPAASPDHQKQRAGDVVAGSCSLLGVGLLAVSCAPVTAVILGTVGTVYGVVRSVDVLSDRSDHKQSIGLDNVESLIAWSTIGTSAVAGASSLALAKSSQIVNASGKYANVARAALKGVNVAAATSSFCNIGTYAYILTQKIAKGQKLTSYDYLQLAASLFLVYGTVANSRQMNKFINGLESAPTISTAVDRNAEVREVITLDENKPVNSFGFNLIVNAGQHFLNRHINFENFRNIYLKCLEIWQTCKDLKYNNITLVVFANRMHQHVQNLFILVSRTLKLIKEKAELLLNQYFYHGNVPSSLTDQIGHMIKNTTSAVKKVNERSLEENEPQPTQNVRSKLDIILEAAKTRVPRTTKTGQLISEFSKQLSSLIDEIIAESNNSYEEFVSKNIEVLGKMEAEEIFSKLGIKTLNDFANLNFNKVMESKGNGGESNRLSVDDGIIPTVLTAYKTLLAKVNSQSIISELDALGSCQLLKQSLSEFFNPLNEKFNVASKLYNINVSFLGHSTAMKIVLNALKVNSSVPDSINNSTFLNLAIQSLNFDKIAEVLSAAIGTEKRTNKVNNQLDDESIHVTVLLLCDKFFRKVESSMNITSDTERERRIKDCYHYLMKNFTAFMETKREQNVEISYCSKLQNSPFSNQQSFIQYYKKLNELNNQEMFASAVEHFTAEKNLSILVAKYRITCKDANNFYVPVCNEISEVEDGMRIYSINEGTYSNLRAYKSTAAKVLGLNEYDMELLKWEKGTLIFKCGCDKKVIFQNVDTKLMILMEVDTSKEPSM